MKTRNVLNTSLGKFFQFLSSSLLVVVVLAGINLHQAYARSLAESPNALTAFCDSVTEIPKSVCEALVALYNSTGGVNWTHKDNWLVTTTTGDWYGVTVSDGHISHITLWINHLTGSLPPQLGNLTALQVLDLRSNQLTGSIPPELGNLTALEWLNLSYNQFTGSIPPELGNLTALLQLVLYNNQLTGNLPPQLGNLTALHMLGLSSNQFTGSIPIELGNLTALEWLDLSSNQFTGSIPNELGNLTALQELFLNNNPLTGSIPNELGNLTALQWLDLSSNQLTGSIPSSFVNLSILDIFYFFDTDLCEPATTEYLAWKATIWLYEGTGESCVEFSCSAVTGIPQSECEALVALYNSTGGVNWTHKENWLVTTTPGDWYGVIVSEGHVSTIHLHYNHLTGSLPTELGNLTALQVLDLHYNPLTGSIPSSFVNLSILNIFYFFDTDLCEPATTEYIAWKTNVANYWGTEVSCEIEEKGYSTFLPSMQK